MLVIKQRANNSNFFGIMLVVRHQVLDSNFFGYNVGGGATFANTQISLVKMLVM
jgi:hypothetical protein